MKQQEPITRVVRQLRSGQITIPAEFRRRLWITEATLLELTLRGGELRLKPLRLTGTAADSPWLKELYERFAPVREEAKGYSEEQVNTAIDDAVKAARKQHA